MVLRLGRSIDAVRDIDVGYGVSFTFRPFSYAEYKSAEAAAQKLARSGLSMSSQIAVETADDEDLPEQVEQEIRGRFHSVLLLILLDRFCTSWAGVELEDGTPAPTEYGCFEVFLKEFPGVANTLAGRLLAPFFEVEQEGNGSAPSPSTGLEVG
jgi:hypothetical protein